MNKDFHDFYEILPNEVIHQKTIINPKVYDEKYIETYTAYNDELSYLRYAFMMGVIDTQYMGKINQLLDVGYGNGSFLKVCKKVIPYCYGYDISGFPLPEGVERVTKLTGMYDMVCFFDSLEHFDDIEFIKDMHTKFIYISVPWCHFFNIEWFMAWKHRKQDEHLWHFDARSLNIFMREMGYRQVITPCNVEDIIRKPVDLSYRNILTCIYERI